MSVRHEIYLIRGCRIPADLFEMMDEKDLEFPWCGKGATGKMGILFDGMNGEYIVAGKCLAVFSEEEGEDTIHCMNLAGCGDTEISNWLISNGISNAMNLDTFLISHYH